MIFLPDLLDVPEEGIPDFKKEPVTATGILIMLFEGFLIPRKGLPVRNPLMLFPSAGRENDRHKGLVMVQETWISLLQYSESREHWLTRTRAKADCSTFSRISLFQ